MEILYAKSPFWDEKMISGLFREKIGELHIRSDNLELIMNDLKNNFRTNLDVTPYKLSDLDILLWIIDEEPGVLQITFNSQNSAELTRGMLDSMIELLKKQDDPVKEIKIFRDCVIDSSRVKDFLCSLFFGDSVENIIEHTSRLCLVDSNTYLNDETIKEMVDQLETLLFEEIVNKKIRVNGKVGVLKVVNDPYGRFGFFERGVKKNYVFLSLVQKMGTKTIRELIY